jgi:hypothetical protein
VVYVADGRIVSAREPGMRPDDLLLRLLLKIRCLSAEQQHGLMAIHQESGRDLEDLLLNGRYLEPEALASCLERQILDTLTRISVWESGTYRFDPAVTWKGARLVKLSTEGALIEAARRMDEGRRQRAMFGDPHRVLGIREMPDPEEPLSNEEREVFAIVDGQRTVADVVEAAPLTEYESYEALQRMVESGWVEFVGRREPGQPAPAKTATGQRGASLAREIAAVAVGILVIAGFLAVPRLLPRATAAQPVADDVFVAARIRDLRATLELYRSERGAYPEALNELIEDRWLAPASLSIPDHRIRYERIAKGSDYRIRLERAR